MGNVGSGFGNAASRCGFEDGYYPVHAPLGFPNCANYKGTPAQRFADLQRRGYGTDIINAWKKYYAENPSDPNKIDYTKQDPKINNSMSKKAALAEQASISSVKTNPRTYGTFADRMRMSREYAANEVKYNIVARTATINAILKNPDNIERWNKEELKKQEDERLIQVQLQNEKIEKERLEQELIQKQIEDQRLQEIEDQMITFNEQQNSGDFNETPITEINPMDSCSGCGVDIHNLPYDDWVMPDDFYDIPNKDKENYLKIGGIAAVGIVAYLVFKK